MTAYDEKIVAKTQIKTDTKTQPIKVVSVSLGSSTRNKKVITNLLGKEVHIERIGTDGNLKNAINLIKKLDGKVDAIGLGGINLYLSFYEQKYKVHEAKLMAEAAKITPVVDGFVLKQTIEPQLIRTLKENNIVDFDNKNVLVVSTLDRAAMAFEIYNMNTNDKYCDLAFGLGIPYTFNKSQNVALLRFLARIFMPIICLLPFSLFYPLGKKQEKTITKYAHLFEWADIIVGDFHYIRRYASCELKDKVIITSTTTKEDKELLKQKGVSIFATTTPDLDGRSYGTNVIEAVIIALSNKKPEEMTEEDYYSIINQLNWKPNIQNLQENKEIIIKNKPTTLSEDYFKILIQN